ncbi:hypothetical protein FHS36_003962 [Streptomyces eurocidicus]|uniref:Uncharacterized protein n=1 Tax=Streptomyces eurocidicus TaxID=66423 RepID=A0A7W8BBY3_STREU|nr:hypothetical protein [Streptomyces eurocidicus]
MDRFMDWSTDRSIGRSTGAAGKARLPSNIRA